MTKDTIYHKRPYTYSGLYVFAGITSSTYHEYKSYSEYSSVIKFIDESIRENKYVGAAAGYFNANIIARDLGLRESQDIKSEVNGSMNHDHTASGPFGDAVTELLKSRAKE